MMPKSNVYSAIQAQLLAEPRTWLITGVAGFIGSNLLEALLLLNQRVIGVDNFATGYQRNLDEVESLVDESQWRNFRFIEGDIQSVTTCRQACYEVDYVLHQAALGSVPRSLKDPLSTNAVNVSGFLNMLVASKEAKARSFTYAASSSTYGDHPGLPKIEDQIGSPLSPYAVTKYVNELYAGVFSRCYGFRSTGLRYFNVFGPRQDPEGAYAAVIPKWIASLIKDEKVFINGDGETSRDFCFIENVVQANILAACALDRDAKNEVFNVALGERTTLNQLYELIRKEVSRILSRPVGQNPIYREFREGDVRHSQADISKAKAVLGYQPNCYLASGLQRAMPWYVRHIEAEQKKASWSQCEQPSRNELM